jgi:dimeric dUTPase (all-alpha-NTP-PPase superfamily)
LECAGKATAAPALWLAWLRSARAGVRSKAVSRSACHRAPQAARPPSATGPLVRPSLFGLLSAFGWSGFGFPASPVMVVRALLPLIPNWQYRTACCILPRMQKPDQLRELFRMQQALNERIGVKTDGMSDEEKTKWLLNYCRAMSQEIAELTDSVPWKWWAKYQQFDQQNARVEVVDLFHFLISMAQVLGMSADDVFNSYVKKNEVNFKRQETGYAVKDEHDSKHI